MVEDNRRKLVPVTVLSQNTKQENISRFFLFEDFACCIGKLTKLLEFIYYHIGDVTTQSAHHKVHVTNIVQPLQCVLKKS